MTPPIIDFLFLKKNLPHHRMLSICQLTVSHFPEFISLNRVGSTMNSWKSSSGNLLIIYGGTMESTNVPFQEEMLAYTIRITFPTQCRKFLFETNKLQGRKTNGAILPF
jgi:hypothetical protein